MRICIVIASCLSVSGCFFTETQLNTDTLDMSTTVADIQERQVINNLIRVIDDPYAIPAQVVLTGGGVQVSNQLSPSLAVPFTDISKTSRSVNLGVSNQWVENWSLAPITDPDDIRRLRALYRLAVWRDNSFGSEYPVPLERTSQNAEINCDLSNKASPPNSNSNAGPPVCPTRPYFAPTADVVHHQWLFWNKDPSTPPSPIYPPEAMPPRLREMATALKDDGQPDNKCSNGQNMILLNNNPNDEYALWACPKKDFDDFVVWVLGATPNSVGGGAGSKGAGGGGGPGGGKSKGVASPALQAVPLQ